MQRPPEGPRLPRTLVATLLSSAARPRRFPWCWSTSQQVQEGAWSCKEAQLRSFLQRPNQLVTAHMNPRTDPCCLLQMCYFLAPGLRRM